MKLDPNDPAAGLNLGNLLRVQQRMVEAEAAYRWAVRVERERLAEAVDCQKRALDADPHYADAMFNLALFLQRVGEHADAAIWWRRYLEHDRMSSWAERAKRALKYCEMQMASAASQAVNPASKAQATGRP